MISYIDFIISLNHNMKSYLKTCIEIIVMKSYVDEIIQWFHGSEFMTMISCLISCYEINSKNHEIVYMKRIFGRALSRFWCGFGRSRVAFHYDCTMNSNCAQPGSGWLDAEQERRPAAEPAAEQCAACAPPCCWAMSHPAPGRVPAALQCATDCWAGAAAMVHARMVLRPALQLGLLRWPAAGVVWGRGRRRGACHPAAQLGRLPLRRHPVTLGHLRTSNACSGRSRARWRPWFVSTRFLAIHFLQKACMEVTCKQRKR